jgi:hypothetical protein
MGLIPNFLIGPFPRLKHFAHGPKATAWASRSTAADSFVLISTGLRRSRTLFKDRGFRARLPNRAPITAASALALFRIEALFPMKHDRVLWQFRVYLAECRNLGLTPYVAAPRKRAMRSGARRVYASQSLRSEPPSGEDRCEELPRHSL